MSAWINNSLICDPIAYGISRQSVKPSKNNPVTAPYLETPFLQNNAPLYSLQRDKGNVPMDTKQRKVIQNENLYFAPNDKRKNSIFTVYNLFRLLFYLRIENQPKPYDQ
jgi:hypothetical protein